MAPLRIYTRCRCEDCQAAKEFLEVRGLAFEKIHVERPSEAVLFVEKANQGKRRTPTFEIEGRTFHCLPFSAGKLEANRKVTGALH